ncbi:hypothetical protein ASZ90_012860 [hydrocarbon metagenome]|uniref:Uncharacterized protein n=1 Tax=hydrocarbon metagenome TaxID=938273 RepID=A0A0W8F9C0_9ZZZZ
MEITSQQFISADVGKLSWMRGKGPAAFKACQKRAIIPKIIIRI